MTQRRDVDRLIRAYLEEGPIGLPARSYEAVRNAVDVKRQRVGFGPWRTPRMFNFARLVMATTAVVLVGAVVGTGSIGPPRNLSWTPDAARYDWPGPIRTGLGGRPAANSTVKPGDRVPDTVADVAAPGWIDIAGVSIRTQQPAASRPLDGVYHRIGLELAAPLPTVPPPATSWIAYGLVLDIDGDGIADQRIGMDNASNVAGTNREWITNLETGVTSVNPGPPYGHLAFGTVIETYYVGEMTRPDVAEVAITRPPEGLRFYAWASVIQSGVVVATDFAPDEGWIETHLAPLDTR